MLLYLALIDTPEDKNKFEEIYISYEKTMFYVANRILKDRHLSEDAVHQAFLRIVDNLDKIEEISSHKTKGFIVIITENIAIDLYRKRKREACISFDEIEIYVEDTEDIASIFENQVEQAIAKLPVNYLTIFKLKYSHGYSDREISEL
ncbi:RNA polymerase sigma factor, partial [Anaerotignum sp.]|uniref:RNA polymerase sigma factor n=1 Tax=Anaerotignum sp. TaxID=2039241 RepID=UPI0028A83255